MLKEKKLKDLHPTLEMLKEKIIVLRARLRLKTKITGTVIEEETKADEIFM